MLKRKIERQLAEWKNTSGHKPLIVKGCRQCGKTFSVLDFAKKNYKHVAQQLGISPHQLSYVTHSNSGEGLLFYGDTIVPFVDRFPQDTEIYKLLTTKFADLKEDAK